MTTVEQAICDAVAKHIDFNEAYVFLFGSRATGHAEERSDYDIGLYTGQRIPLLTLAHIREELDRLPTLHTIDVIDFSTVSEDFKKVALKKIQLWSTPKKNLKLI